MGGVEWRDKVAVVTGASRGIGRAIAELFARQGLRLTLVARSQDALLAFCTEHTLSEARALICAGDLSDPFFPQKVVEQTVEHFGQLDVIVNNAGIAFPASLEETTLEQWDLQMAVNVRAPFLICKAALPYLRRSQVPTIVNIASVVAYKGYVNQGAYTASKHALLGFSKVLAREVHKDGIRGHVVSPGGVATEMITSMRPDLDPSILVPPREIAEIVWFLISKRGNAVIDEVSVRRFSKEPWI